MADHGVLIRQLQEALGGKQVRIGTSTITFTASATSATAVVAHGLGREPEGVWVNYLSSGGSATVVAVPIIAKDTDSFDLQGRASSAITATLTVYWLAIG